MKKCTTIALMIICFVFFVSCSNNHQDDSTNELQTQKTTQATTITEPATTETIETTISPEDSPILPSSLVPIDPNEPQYWFVINDIEDKYPGKKIINWVVNMSLSEDFDLVIGFNDMLVESGADYVLQFVSVSQIYNYQKTIDKLIADGVNIDIFGTGSYTSSLVGDMDKDDYVDNSMIDSYIYFYNKGYLYRLDDYLLSGNGSKLYRHYSDKVWESVKIDGGIYGLTPGKNLNFTATLDINHRNTDGLNLTLDNVTSDLKSLEPIADAITNKTGKPSVILTEYLEFVAEYLGYIYVCGNVVIDKNSNTAINLLESSKFKNYIHTAKEFVDKGYINSNIYTDYANEAIMFGGNANEAFYDMIYTAKPHTLFVQSAKSALAIYAHALHPIEALDLLTLLRTDTAYADQLVYGNIGKAKIHYPLGLDLYWSTSIVCTDTPNLRERVDQYDATIVLDKYSSYHFDGTKVKETLKSINAILFTYINPMVGGSTGSSTTGCSFLTGHDDNPLQTLDELNAKLNENGLTDKLLDAVNESLKNIQ